MGHRHKWRVEVVYNGMSIKAFPFTDAWQQEAGIEQVYSRIGQMVLSDATESVTVYRDGEVYRKMQVERGEAL